MAAEATVATVVVVVVVEIVVAAAVAVVVAAVVNATPAAFPHEIAAVALEAEIQLSAFLSKPPQQADPNAAFAMAFVVDDSFR